MNDFAPGTKVRVRKKFADGFILGCFEIVAKKQIERKDNPKTRAVRDCATGQVVQIAVSRLETA